MAIKRFKSNADNTITNAFRSNLTQRGLNANMGASDVLETFSLYGQASSGSTELERILIKFPISDVIAARTAGTVPASGNVNFYLRMFNAETSQTVPRDLQLQVQAIEVDWQEGTGLDMDEYKDVVAAGDIGSTWMSASSTAAWIKMGGDYHISPTYTQTFPLGTEDLNVDITPLVEQWIAGTKTNYGVGVHLVPGQEARYDEVEPREAVYFDQNSFLYGEIPAAMTETQPFTMAGWVNPGIAGGVQYIAQWRMLSDTTTFARVIYKQASHFIVYYQIYSGNDLLMISGAPVALDEWTHITITHDPEDLATLPKLYFDGVLQTFTQLSIPTGTPEAFDQLEFGGRTGDVFMYSGSIDDFVYYDTQLSASNISELYNGGCPIDIRDLPTTYPNAKHWWINGDDTRDVIRLGTPPTQISIYDQIGDLDLYASGTGAMAIVNSVCYSSGGIFGGNRATGEIANTGGSTLNYYTKKFFGKGSEFFFKTPALEARWDSALKDDRGNFYASSSLLPASENNRTLYLHNVIGGRLFNIPAVGTGEIYLQTYDASTAGTQIGTTVTGGYVSQGVYSASFALDTTASTVYDRWYNSGLSECYYTGTIGIKTHDISGYNPYSTYVTTLTNLNPIYYPHETARFRFYVRNKDWSPNLYTVANSINDTLIIESASYQIHRVVDDLKIIAFDTGSTRSTETSFDVSGNYFDLDMSLFEPGYSYAIRMAFYTETVSSYVEQPSEWKFRVDKLETQ
jgi:hypothetical protein